MILTIYPVFRYKYMRVVSFIVFIIGCVLAFSGESTGWGIALMVIGVLLNWGYHLSNKPDNKE